MLHPNPTPTETTDAPPQQSDVDVEPLDTGDWRDPLFFDGRLFRESLDVGTDPQTVKLRRALLVVLLLCGTWGLHQVVKLCRWIDDLFFSGYRDVKVEKPLFIVANPRSGTTFLQRLMCLDGQFAFFKTYQTLLPAAWFYRLVDRLTGTLLGKVLGAPFAWIEKKFFTPWDGVHTLRWDAAEEDEGIYFLSLVSPGLFLFMPEVSELDRANQADFLERPLPSRLAAFYRSCVQRMLYVRPGKRYLGKSVFFAQRLYHMKRAFPDMRVVHLVRHPYEAIPSFMSMWRIPWDMMAPGVPDTSPRMKELAQLAIDNYRKMHDAQMVLGDQTIRTVRYTDLVADPKKTVEEIYAWAGIDLSEEYRRILQEETQKARKYKSGHSYSMERFNLTKDDIYEPLKDVFEAYGFER